MTKIETEAQLAALVGVMRDRLRAHPECGQSLREVERDGIRFTLGVAPSGYVSISYTGLDAPDLSTAKAWRVEADHLNVGPVR
jgi:hypothetical protein